jgi:hypothetical protein
MHLADSDQVNDAPCPPLTSHGASIMLQKQQHLPDEVQKKETATGAAAEPSLCLQTHMRLPDS